MANVHHCRVHCCFLCCRSTNWLLAAYVPITLHQVVWYTEVLFLILFALSAVYDSLLYWQPRWSSGVVELTQNQIKLLGVRASGEHWFNYTHRLIY